ncbi:unnamed protein product, partial [Rotaria sp. Silwood2]
MYQKLRLIGLKLSCGACTGLISRCIDRYSSKIGHRTINAYLAP